MSIDDDDVFAIKKEKTLESEKQRLRDTQENEYENPDNIYVKINIQKKGKVGGECVVKFSKKVPRAKLVISQDIQWKKRDKYDLKGKPELVCRGFIIEEAKDCKEIRCKWEDMGQLHGKPYNFLLAGEYCIEVRAYSTEFEEETTSRRLITIT